VPKPGSVPGPRGARRSRLEERNRTGDFRRVLPAATQRLTGFLRRGQGLGERNFLGTGKDASARSGGDVWPINARGIDSGRRSEPYFFSAPRVSAGPSSFTEKQTTVEPPLSVLRQRHLWARPLQLGHNPWTEQLGVMYRYSLYNQNIHAQSGRRLAQAAAVRLPIKQAAASPGPAWVFPPSATPSPTARSTTPRGPTSGFQFATQAGIWRALGGEREIPAHHRGPALLPPESTMTCVSLVGARKAGYVTGLGRPGQGVPAAQQLSSAVRRWCGGFAPQRN